MSDTFDPAPCEDPMLRFSIAPTQSGAWLWRTLDHDGQTRAQGLSPTRKLAAALVIREIVRARVEPLTAPLSHPTAKAA
ncbi:hypothetical protein [Caulobacter segnis]